MEKETSSNSAMIQSTPPSPPSECHKEILDLQWNDLVQASKETESKQFWKEEQGSNINETFGSLLSFNNWINNLKNPLCTDSGSFSSV